MSVAKMVLELEDYICNVGKHYRVPFLDDYKQEVLLILLEKGNDFLIELNKKGKLQPYCYKICLLLLYSKEGAYYKKYIYPHTHFKELTGIERIETPTFKEDRINDLLNDLKGFDKVLIEQLIECRGNKRELSKKANISYSTINSMLDNLGTKIKKKYNLNDFYD